MNYKRIYDEFIADRKTKQPSKPDYYEIHHIIPRCMGGDDGPSNLIRLTASDHLFAHLLLAKAHGGRMWSAVNIMAVSAGVSGVAGRVKRGRPPNIRSMYSLAKKLASNNISGEKNHNSDINEYHWKNVDGREFTATRALMARMFGLKQYWLAGVVLGIKKSTNGWYLPSLVPSGIVGNAALSGVNSTSRDLSVYRFCNVDGRSVACTRQELIRDYGANQDGLDSIVSRRSKSTEGWYISTIVNAHDVGNRIGSNHWNHSDDKFDMVHIDGARETCTLFSMREKYGGSGWARIRSGATCYGWRLDGAKPSRKGIVMTYTHSDGRVIAGTQADMVKCSGLTRSQASRVSLGKPMNGWSASAYAQ